MSTLPVRIVREGDPTHEIGCLARLSWSMEQMQSELARRFHLGPGTVLVKWRTGENEGKRVEDVSQLKPRDQLVVVHVSEASPSETPISLVHTDPATPLPAATLMGRAGAGDDVARRAAVEWLLPFAQSPMVRADIESWSTVGAPVQLGPADVMPPPPAKDRIAKSVVDALSEFDIAMVVEVTTSVVDVLSCVGTHLEGFGCMLGMSPFSVAFRAIGLLCQAAGRVKENNENCERIRRRATMIVPILVAIWRRQECGSALNDVIKTVITRIKELLDSQAELVKSYMDSGWLSRGLNSSRFKSEAQTLDQQMTQLMDALQLGLQEQFAVRLDEVFVAVKRMQDMLQYEINPKLDALLIQGDRILSTVDESAAMIAEISLKLDEMAMKEAVGFVVPYSREQVLELFQVNDTRKFYVRDTGKIQRVPSGPEGHHYTCDVLHSSKVLSFRITRRSSDSLYVLDNHFPVDRDNKYTVALPSRPYNPVLPAFRNMGELLYNVAETSVFLKFNPSAGGTYN